MHTLKGGILYHTMSCSQSSKPGAAFFKWADEVGSNGDMGDRQPWKKGRGNTAGGGFGGKLVLGEMTLGRPARPSVAVEAAAPKTALSATSQVCQPYFCLYQPLRREVNSLALTCMSVRADLLVAQRLFSYQDLDRHANCKGLLSQTCYWHLLSETEYLRL